MPQFGQSISEITFTKLKVTSLNGWMVYGVFNLIDANLSDYENIF